MGSNLFWLSVGFGFVTASVLAIASLGLTLQFGVTNFVNFAYGDFMTFGAYITWTLNAKAHWNIWVATVIGSLTVGALAVVLSKTILTPFTRRFSNLFYILIVTFGLSLILLNVIQVIWGPNFQLFAIAPENPLHLGPFLFTPIQLGIIGIGVGIIVAIHLMLTRTKTGKAMRAMSDNASLAMASGIDTNRVTTITWFLTGVLAGLGGTVFALNTASLVPGLGEGFLFVIFAAVIVGGIGKPYGAMLGALVIGLATEISGAYINAAYKLDVAFLALILVLLVRPQGIFATAGKA